MDEKQFFTKRMIDLSRQANEWNCPIFSDFLTLGEQQELQAIKGELYSNITFYGGHAYAERQIGVFLPDALSTYMEDSISYPVCVLKIEAVNQKFADALNHRDVLGALMHLGIDRGTLGDILIKDSIIYVFVLEKMESFFMEEIKKIKHTMVTVRKITDPDFSIQPNFLECNGIVSSLRLDAVLSCMTGVSRAKVTDFIRKGLVQWNGLEETHIAKTVVPGTILSCRGYGKYIFDEETGSTKKERIKITYRKYQ